MLKALDSNQQIVHAWEAHKGEKYFCPECELPTILKAGTQKVSHFAHKQKESCFYGAGETQEHLRMKTAIANLLKDQFDVQVEQQLIPNRRADVVIKKELPEENRTLIVAIECQHSPISIEEFEERNLDYSKYGIPVLWVWSSKRLGFRFFEEIESAINNGIDFEKRIPVEIRKTAYREWVKDDNNHFASYNLIHVMDQNGDLRRIRMNDVIRYSEWDGDMYEKKLESIKRLSIYEKQNADISYNIDDSNDIEIRFMGESLVCSYGTFFCYKCREEKEGWRDKKACWIFCWDCYKEDEKYF